MWQGRISWPWQFPFLILPPNFSVSYHLQLRGQGQDCNLGFKGIPLLFPRQGGHSEKPEISAVYVSEGL